ncbi:hypothetical protein [Morganella morganii]|uniref:hypothetical protein n=1 Tax=Morganella morganii TaxID=582 RepID=UPI003D7F1CF6
MSVYFVISVLIIFIIILLIVLTITDKIVIRRKKTVYLSLIVLFFAFFIKSTLSEKELQLKTRILDMSPTLKAINQVDPEAFDAFFADYKNAGSIPEKEKGIICGYSSGLLQILNTCFILRQMMQSLITGKCGWNFYRKHWHRIHPVTSAFACCIRKCQARRI